MCLSIFNYDPLVCMTVPPVQVILVANKADLVRNRQVKAAGELSTILAGTLNSQICMVT